MRNQEPTPSKLEKLPSCAAEFIKLLIKKMRYRKKVRAEVMAELTSHFADALKDCESDKQKDQKAQGLITEFGDAKLLAVLLRRAKKRCRPLWRTIAARAIQSAGVLILLLAAYVAWFLTGKPSIRVDYVALINQMSKPEISDVDNAWPYYERAIGLFAAPPVELEELLQLRQPQSKEDKSFASLTEKKQSKMVEWVERNEEAWQHVVRAGSKPYLWRKYEVGSRNKDNWTIGILLPNLKSVKRITVLGIWRARIAMEKGRVRQAMQDSAVVAQLAAHWQQRTTLVEHLTALAAAEHAHEQILAAVATGNLSDADIRDLHQQLLQMYPQGFPLIDMESERLMFLDTVQQVFTDGGPGGGHLIPERLADFMESEGLEARHLALSFLHARRDETLTKGNELYDRLIKISRATPCERHLRNYSRSGELISALAEYRYFVLRSIVPALDNLQRYAYRCKALHEATLTVLALQRHRLEKNEYPEKLDELITAGHLEQLPMDPYGDGPLVYKRTDQGFLLYSLGANFTDDGGTRHGPSLNWGKDEGDRVFWPIETYQQRQERYEKERDKSDRLRFFGERGR